MAPLSMGTGHVPHAHCGDTDPCGAPLRAPVVVVCLTRVRVPAGFYIGAFVAVSGMPIRTAPSASVTGAEICRIR
jgi:hypothetical protein